MALSQQPVTQENVSWAELFAHWVVAGNGSVIAGRICDLRVVSTWEKMCGNVPRIAERGWGGEKEQGVLCEVAAGTKVRWGERVASYPRAADLLLKRTRVRQGKTFQDVETNKRDFQT